MGCFKHIVFGTQSLGYCLVYDSIVGKKSVLNIFFAFCSTQEQCHQAGGYVNSKGPGLKKGLQKVC